jgi:hypothetical protein
LNDNAAPEKCHAIFVLSSLSGQAADNVIKNVIKLALIGINGVELT